ncbi:MAG: hypothetical protein KDC53_05220, partial [Saprospiraceae bacterium]|nr:hypothetical protein [Saprospiraceae bacterium]
MKRKIVEFQFEISKNTLLFQSLLRVINTTIIIILALLPGVSLFSQINNESNVIAKTTVEYDCNSPNAIVTFPLNGDGICPSAPLLRWMEVYSINIDGSQSLEARVSADNISGDLMHEKTCVTTLVTYPAGSSASEPFCRYYDICDVGNVLHSEIVAYTEVPNGSPAERYMKLTVPSSTGIIHLVGDYDFGYDGFQIDNGFDVDFQKQDPFPGIDCPGYETPIYNFSSSMTNVSVSSLPLPICGDIGGVTTTSVLDALQADESEYLLTRRNEVYSFRVNITHSNQTVNNGAIQVFYKSNPGTPLQKDSLLLSVTLSPSTSSAVTQSFPISYIPAKGSLGDVLQVQFSELATYYNIYIPVAVEGIIDDRVPALGEFTTPKIPYLILHDPPGDESYASFEATKKVCHATSTTITSSDSRGGSLTLQAGFEGSFDLAPVSANLVSTLAITGSYTVTKTINNFHEKETCLEFKDNIETPRLESKIGHSADVFIGNATKLKYGIYDQVIMENCELSVQQGLVYGPDPKNIMQTQFTLTEADIESDIDTQTNIVNDLSRSLFEREQAYNQAKVWQQILDRNKSNRDHANYPIGRSQSAGTSRTSGFSESTNTTSNLNYDVAIDKGVAIEVKILIAGNGIYGGPELNFNTTSSGGYSTTQESDSAFYYTIYDEEDKIDFDIGIDPDYGTPMFRLSENAATSCPYEGGKRLYAPQIYIEQEKVAPEMGVFKCPFISRDNIMTDSIELELVIYNGDQESPRNFSLWAGKQSGNLPVISVGGAPLVNKIVELGTVPANDTIRRTIVMTKSTSQNRYDNIYLRAFASCMAGNIPGNIEDFPTWIANENDSLIINLTFGGPGNYPPDMDCDGVPDTTDPCPNTTSEGDDDCDGIPNSQDDCPLDPNNTDADLDAIPDCIDLCADQESTLNFERSSAINSDNNADFVSIPHDDALNLAGKDFTVQAWVQPSDDFYKTIIAKGGATSAETNFALVIWNSDVNDEHNGKLGLLLNNEWHYSDNQIPLNRWTHVAVTFEKDGQQAEFYIDGQFSGRKRYSSSATTANSNAMTIGVWELGSIQPTSKQWGFKGSMDELNIWNRK